MNLCEVTATVIDRLAKLGMSDSYLIVPTEALPTATVLRYWQALENADTLKYRWSDTDPNKLSAEVITEYCISTDNMYNVLDIQFDNIVADFSLGPFMGKSAQIHFSMLPGSPTQLSVFLANEVTDTILYNWKAVKNLKESFVDTLIGLTPVSNRPACVFIRKAGFIKMGTILSGTNYLNETDNALVTTKSRTN